MVWYLAVVVRRWAAVEPGGGQVEQAFDLVVTV
jgi:hypothetical protein